jgi:hypothetical protein
MLGVAAHACIASVADSVGHTVGKTVGGDKALDHARIAGDAVADHLP